GVVGAFAFEGGRGAGTGGRTSRSRASPQLVGQAEDARRLEHEIGPRLWRADRGFKRAPCLPPRPALCPARLPARRPSATEVERQVVADEEGGRAVRHRNAPRDSFTHCNRKNSGKGIIAPE